MSTHPQDNPPRGIVDSFRALLHSVVTILHGRAELFSAELEEEVSRLVRVLLWALVAVFCVIIGASFLGTMVLVAAPEKYRALAAAGLALVFVAMAAVAFRAIRRILRSKPRPFDATLGELEKDREALRSRR